MYLKTQKFFILGISKSGFAVAKYALEKGAECYVYEELRNSTIDANIEELISLGAKYVNVDDYERVLANIDVLVLSPGVPINHKISILAKKLGKRILGELEFGFLQFEPTFVAVTGTNGKTTTVSLLEYILKENGVSNVKTVGNIGLPISSIINETEKDDVCVVEVSSFQLETTSAFCPHVSCVLNIAPDHLERHYTMDNYVFLKKRIFKNQRESEYTVLNYDDKIVKKFAEETLCKVVWVSIYEKVDGAYRLDGKIYYYDEYVMEESELKLKGEHNVYDCLFALCCAKLLGVSNSVIVNALQNFKGIRHRIEFIAEKNLVNYYNDSKATNTASTISALDVMNKPTVLILGGSDKGEDYFNLFEKIKRSMVKHVVITGDTRLKMLDQAGKVGFTDLTVTSDFLTAIKIAQIIANEGDNVLLSPACASFNQFKNYEERGDFFRSVVEDM